MLLFLSFFELFSTVKIHCRNIYLVKYFAIKIVAVPLFVSFHATQYPLEILCKL